MTQESAARKILVVDDSVSIVFSIGKILELNGYAVDSAYNGSDALRKISQQVELSYPTVLKATTILRMAILGAQQGF